MIYRATKMSSGVYAIEITDSIQEEAENIQDFLDQGETVVLSDDLDEIAELFDIGVSDIILVEEE